MKITRTSRILTAIVALFSMLFMQLAVASYACPQISMTSEAASVSMSGMPANMPDCASMDPVQPALCHTFAHGELTKQSLDKHAIPDIQPFVPLALLAVVQPLDIVPLATTGPVSPVTLVRHTDPPIAIRN